MSARCGVCDLCRLEDAALELVGAVNTVCDDDRILVNFPLDTIENVLALTNPDRVRMACSPPTSPISGATEGK